MFIRKSLIACISLLALFLSCQDDDQGGIYYVSGSVINEFGEGIEGIKVFYSASDFVLSDSEGNWEAFNLMNTVTLSATDSLYRFQPTHFQVNQLTKGITFTGSRDFSDVESRIISWFNQQQLANGLLESTENGNVVSLYDNALAALVFMLNNDFQKAEKIFDYFNAKISTELRNGVGGFSQFRDRNGVPSNHRWMGDNAWLLIALNNYKSLSGNNQYDLLSNEISNWLNGLQDIDGGLFAGYDANDSLLDYKVTEGNIDAYNAISGFSSFHSNLIDFLKQDRWDSTDQNLMAWPDNPAYRYALDNHSWSYCIFKDYPISALHTASRFLTSQIASVNGNTINGYDIDEDKDAVFMEGTAQMALAFKIAGLSNEANTYLQEMEKLLIASKNHTNASGFPYSSNLGTTFGNSPLWAGADTNIAISPGAWYLFAKSKFNPFAVEREKAIPIEKKFWLN